ncbi:hypothetical protein [Lignipirellula cremea]|uniref:Alpha/beta hydrolase family protein n=1 Tax=Lignipirellula cremea TaxID=2528010 RepID=A0A518E069_9BACT|nr:hypothetical protein [Lignipirellula cremea]QDU97475.1 hypothetical protein Pla8534_53230 [Lignipirellula cremea]
MKISSLKHARLLLVVLVLSAGAARMTPAVGGETSNDANSNSIGGQTIAPVVDPTLSLNAPETSVLKSAKPADSGQRVAKAAEESQVAAVALPVAIATAEPVMPVMPLVMSPVAVEDELWIISTRRLGYPARHCTPQLSVRKHDGQCWQQASIEEFLAGAGPDRPTVILVHGNRIESNEVYGLGASFFQTLRQTDKPRPAVRQVIWSWPSDQTRGVIRDNRVKAERAHAEAYYLGWLLGQMPSAAPVSLIGYSFGARSVLGALHMTAGGCLAGHTLPGVSAAPLRARVVLMAAASHCGWLAPHAPYGKALQNTDQLLVFYNTSDSALKFYKFIDHSHPEAMGRVGVGSWNCQGDQSVKVQQWNVANSIGTSHAFNDYRCCYDIMRRVRQSAFWAPGE